jgi:enoyl-CoA hydratase/carnithine racemase
MDQKVRVSREAKIVTVTLCNPAKRNALSLDVLKELTAAFEDVAVSDAVGVVLAAEGPVFRLATILVKWPGHRVMMHSSFLLCVRT